MRKKKFRHGRVKLRRFSAGMAEVVPESQGIWAESEAEMARALAQGAEKERLLRWVRKQMGRRLTVRERECIELYYFRGLTFAQVGQATHTAGSSAFRAVQRGLRKLRAAAAEEGLSRKT